MNLTGIDWLNRFLYVKLVTVWNISNLIFKHPTVFAK
jgi:hypothetical protein